MSMALHWKPTSTIPVAVLRVTALLLVIFGGLSLGYALSHQYHALPAPVLTAGNQPSASPDPSTPASLAASRPVHLTIPAIKVSSTVSTVDLKPDGTPGIPVGANVDNAAWLTSSATPGSSGTSVIVGHVDTVKSGPSVFYNLGRLSPGDTIIINLTDGQNAKFRVSSVQQYSKSNFPSQTVYGRTSSPSLRLITCSGDWDAQSHSYANNLVVFADFTSGS